MFVLGGEDKEQQRETVFYRISKASQVLTLNTLEILMI